MSQLRNRNASDHAFFKGWYLKGVLMATKLSEVPYEPLELVFLDTSSLPNPLVEHISHRNPRASSS